MGVVQENPLDDLNTNLRTPQTFGQTRPKPRQVMMKKPCCDRHVLGVFTSFIPETPHGGFKWGLKLVFHTKTHRFYENLGGVLASFRRNLNGSTTLEFFDASTEPVQITAQMSERFVKQKKHSKWSMNHEILVGWWRDLLKKWLM